ncbi:MAG TPA: MarR family transcriptional regulator [Pseudomonadota bacterium]|nr:MarR family transcriptional regulator [Pseudomonadota bacterium]
MTAIYDPKTFNPKTAIGGLVSRVKLKLFEAMEAELAPYDITAAQYVILVGLANGIDSASGLCKGVSYDPGAMTRMLDRLEKKGLVGRVRCPDDRRVVKLALTEEGKAVYPKLIASAAKVMNRCLAGFTKSEAEQLEGFLHRILENG